MYFSLYVLTGEFGPWSWPHIGGTCSHVLYLLSNICISVLMTLALVKDLERVRLACRYLLKGYSQTQPAPITVNVHQHTSRVCGAPTTRPLCILGSVTWSRGGRPYEMQTLQPESGKKNRKQVPCSRAPGGKLVSIFCSIWFLFLFLSFFSLSFFVFPFQHEKKKKNCQPWLVSNALASEVNTWAFQLYC